MAGRPNLDRRGSLLLEPLRCRPGPAQGVRGPDISVASDLPLFVDPFLLFNKDLGIEGEEAIVLIDARSDNKPSASKA